MRMNTPARIAIVAVAALALAVTDYGQAMNITKEGLQRELWDWGTLAAYVLAVVGVCLVDRWWALLPAAAPIAVTFYLYNFTGYSTPWDSESLGSPSEPVSYAMLLLFSIALHAAFLSIGFLPRRVWNVGRRMWVSRRGRLPSPRG